MRGPSSRPQKLPLRSKGTSSMSLTRRKCCICKNVGTGTDLRQRKSRSITNLRHRKSSRQEIKKTTSSTSFVGKNYSPCNCRNIISALGLIGEQYSSTSIPKTKCCTCENTRSALEITSASKQFEYINKSRCYTCGLPKCFNEVNREDMQSDGNDDDQFCSCSPIMELDTYQGHLDEERSTIFLMKPSAPKKPKQPYIRKWKLPKRCLYTKKDRCNVTNCSKLSRQKVKSKNSFGIVCKEPTCEYIGRNTEEDNSNAVCEAFVNIAGQNTVDNGKFHRHPYI